MSSGFRYRLVNVLHELRPIFETSSHAATHDVVVLSVTDPWAFDVVDFELDIGWNPILRSGRSLAFLSCSGGPTTRAG